VSRPRAYAQRGANWVWSIDFKGSFCTRDGKLVQTLTITDVYSHYILALDTVRALSVHEVMARMKRVFRRYGLPRAIRVDHGAPWYGPGSRGWTQLSVWWVRLGIAVEYIALNGNSCHEQMHRMLKERTASPPASTLTAQRARFAWWKRHYNENRPHGGEWGTPPNERYRPSTRRLPGVLPSLIYAPTWDTLEVNAYGYVHWRKQKRSIGRAFAGQRIGLRRLRTCTAVYLGTHLLGTLYAHEPALRPVTHGGEADRLPSTPSAQVGSGEGAPPLPLHPIPDNCLRCNGTKLSTM
jgi:putative transposase